ncbi:putative transmembrane protein [Leishmania panamensis]|uniref:Transmembrane protein, putative n=1 Tax=Leishmania panamensis TaxID=5679 RepID=A0A088RRG5_LEIPA|nr:putative transmembrane protein [Leishmania panamensis]AIN98677.1 putative transmembrane protein [Leishmania panamensis]
MTVVTVKYLYANYPTQCNLLILLGSIALLLWARWQRWAQRLRMVARSRMREARPVLQAFRRRPLNWRWIAGEIMIMLANARPLSVTTFSTLLVVHCVLLGIERHFSYRNAPNNIQLWTYQETHFDLTTMGPSLVSPVHDPRSLSPYGPRSSRTLAHFCGRPTASSYDGYTGAPHAAYIHHDVERDRYVVRTFGRGGTRVDERRRSGVGRSTYEAFCAAPRRVQLGTPLAPSPWLDGEANWQLGDAGAAPRHAVNGAFSFAVQPLAVPHAAAAAVASNATASRSADADFTKADQGLRTHYRRYTRDELLQRHAHLDFIYSYVNGSDITRGYTKPFAKTWECWNMIASVQLLWGEMQRAADIGADAPPLAEDAFSRHIAELLFVSSSSPCALSQLLADVNAGKDAMKRVEASLWWAATHPSQPHIKGAPPPPEMALTNMELLHALGADLESVKPDDIDADCDELRHGMRGLLLHTRSWHRGRMTVVTPYGNVPLWLNQSRNFFMRSLYAAATAPTARAEAASGAADGGDASVLGTAEARFVREAHTGKLHYTRIHIVDQRALMPPAPLTTANSYVVEPFVYRLRNASSVFIYMNDDYLVMKDVDITDFVNEFGGPLLRIRKSDSMEYYEANRDYFRRGLVFNTMLMHRDLDRTPADLEELVQPATAAATLTSMEGEAVVVQRGVVRASWAAFAAAVDARSSVATPGGSAQSTSTACARSSSAAVCAWADCAWGAPAGAVARGACAMPRVSAKGEPAWAADAAGTFALVPAPPTKPGSGEWTWTGHVQMPALVHWGRRVLDRVTADLIAPRYYLETETIALTKVEHEPIVLQMNSSSITEHLTGLRNAFASLQGDTQDAPKTKTTATYLLRMLMHTISTYEFPTHRIFKTQPRLRKYRMRLDSHAPYAQCRNMWGYIHKRYAPDLNLNMLMMRTRTTMDLLPPSTHTAHMLRHPWAASSQYLPYLIAKQAWRMQRGAGLSPLGSDASVFPAVDVALDNEDGCAPATYITEAEKSARYHEFRDDVSWNAKTMKRIRSYRDKKPFTNINSKFSSNEVGVTLRNFLEELFPTPMLLERQWSSALDSGNGTDELRVSSSVEEQSGAPNLQFMHLNVNFERLMRLPLILVSNDEEGFCPLLRSLRHVLPDFSGQRVVHVLVPPADGVSLRAARADRRHPYREFLPVARCSLSADRLRRVTLPADSSVADVVVAGLRLAREGVAAGLWEAPALVELRGRRAVQALVLDARTLRAGARGFTELSHALGVPAELLAYEDFAVRLLDAAAQSLVRSPTPAEAATVAAAVPIKEASRRNGAATADDFAASVLVLSEAEAEARHTHWAYGASEHDLLSAMPLPYGKVEDMEAAVQWVF